MDAEDWQANAQLLAKLGLTISGQLLILFANAECESRSHVVRR